MTPRAAVSERIAVAGGMLIGGRLIEGDSIAWMRPSGGSNGGGGRGTREGRRRGRREPRLYCGLSRELREYHSAGRCSTSGNIVIDELKQFGQAGGSCKRGIDRPRDNIATEKIM